MFVLVHALMGLFHVDLFIVWSVRNLRGVSLIDFNFLLKYVFFSFFLLLLFF
jgi:hypothetical protein